MLTPTNTIRSLPDIPDEFRCRRFELALIEMTQLDRRTVLKRLARLPVTPESADLVDAAITKIIGGTT